MGLQKRIFPAGKKERMAKARRKKPDTLSPFLINGSQEG